MAEIVTVGTLVQLPLSAAGPRGAYLSKTSESQIQRESQREGGREGGRERERERERERPLQDFDVSAVTAGRDVGMVNGRVGPLRIVSTVNTTHPHREEGIEATRRDGSAHRYSGHQQLGLR